MTLVSNDSESNTASRALAEWVAEIARLAKPDRIHWCDGSEDEKRRLTQLAIDCGSLIALNPVKRPGCYLHRSNPNDVARRAANADLHSHQGRSRPDQQLGGARRDLS